MGVHGRDSEYCARVDRVLDAARVLGRLWQTPGMSRVSELQILCEAIHALDAPRALYTVAPYELGWLVRRDGQVYIQLGANADGATALYVRDALNYAERTK